MRFEQPEWLIGLALLPILALVSWLAWKRRGERWKKLIADRLRHRLSHVRAPWIHFTSFGLGLLGLGGIIVALAQPESGEEWIEVENEGRNILFCIDISRSMTAEDLQPSRLQASRSAALEILERFPHDRIGILLFSGETLIQCPLTPDHSFVEQTLSQLDPNDIPIGGSNLSGATNAGIRLLSQTGQKSNIMVIFSDGEKSTEGLEAAANSAADEGIFIYALGMGTREGTFIPDERERDGKFRDRNGNPVFSRLDEDSLQMLAEKSNGFYSRGIGGSFLRKLESALSEMDRFREEGKHQRVAKPAHTWFLFGGIFLLMSSLFVRCLPLRSATAALVLFASASQVDADLISDGREALKRGDQMEAHQFFQEAAGETNGERASRLHLAAGSAAYRAKSWKAAADSFSSALESNDPILQQKAHYALGTSLFYLGVPLEEEKKKQAWLGAVKHLEAALELDPSDAAAAGNLESVKKLLMESQEKSNQPENENQRQKDQQEDKNQEEQEEKDQPDDAGEQESGEDGNEDGGENEKNESQDKESPSPPDGAERDPNDQKARKDQEGEGGENQNDADSNKERSERDQPGTPNSNDKEGDSEKKENPNGGTGKDQNEESQSEPGQSAEADPEDIPFNESKEERARRILKQYADFGGKAPRRIRRSFNRSAHDW